MHWFFKLLIILGITFLPWVFISSILPKILPVEYRSDSEVWGLIIRNQVWEGTIRIKGDIITASSTTITLKPGTNILVDKDDDKFNLDYLPWHLKKGVNTNLAYQGVEKGQPFWDESQKIQLHFSRIDAIGTKEQPIVIRSDSSSPSPYDFNILSVRQGVISNVHASNYRRFEIGDKVTVRDSVFKNTGECSICISFGSPVVINNNFESSLRESIWILRASPKIADNLFNNLVGAGIRLDPQTIGQPIISNNTFEMPSKVALDILSGEEEEGGVVSFNFFSGNSVIKLPCDSKIKIVENSLLGLIEFLVGSCDRTYTFGSNYWGIQDKQTVLAEKILKKEKKFKILIPYLLKDSPKGVGKSE